MSAAPVRVPVAAPAGYEVERVTTPGQLAEVLALRVRVFVDEQRVPLEEEVDAADDDPTTTHVLVRAPSGTVVATARVLPDAPGHVHVGRVAVDARERGTGVGRVVMAAAEHEALARHAGADGAVTVALSAQVQALGFYERLGYTVHGPVYLDAGIEHRDAVRTLRSR